MPDPNPLTDTLATLSPQQLVDLAETVIARYEAVEGDVTAGGRASVPPPQVIATSLAAKRPASTVATPKRESPTVLTASGEPIDEADVIGRLATALGIGETRPGRALVASFRAAEGLPRLGADPYENTATIRRTLDALTASGGICAPTPVRYTQATVATQARPIRDGLPSFAASRGGVVYYPPPTFGDAATGVGLWTATNDRTPTSPTTKPYLVVPCAPEMTETLVDAVTAQLKIGNFAARFMPEHVQAWTETLLADQAALAELTLLATIDSGSVATTSAQVLGTARDVLALIDRAGAQYRSRNRMPDSSALTMIAPSWLKAMMRVDLLRMGHTPNLAATDREIGGLFADRNVRPIWSIDAERFGAQGAGPLDGWPSTVTLYLFGVDEWFVIDGGTLDLGVIRTAESIGTNDAYLFVETFEAAARFGSAGSYKIVADVCASGLTVAADDIDVCNVGS